MWWVTRELGFYSLGRWGDEIFTHTIVFRFALETNQHPASCIPVALFHMLKWLGLSSIYSLSFKDYWSRGFTYLCIVPDAVLKGAQYMFTSNVKDVE